MTPSPLVSAAAIAAMCLIWGTTWVIIKEGLQDLPAMTSAGVRFALAAVLMAVVAALLGKKEGGVRPTLRLVLVSGVFNFGASYGIVYHAETVLPSGLVAVLWAVYPIMMAIVGHFYLPEERLAARQGLGFVVGFLGVALLFLTDLEAMESGAIPAALILMLSPLISAFGHAYIKRHGKDTSSLLLNRDGMFVGAAMLMVVAFVFEDPAEARWTGKAIASVVWLAAVGTVVGFSLYFWMLRHTRASRLALVAYVTPAIALYVGWLFEDEPVTLTMLLGTALIVGGVATVMKK